MLTSSDECKYSIIFHAALYCGVLVLLRLPETPLLQAFKKKRVPSPSYVGEEESTRQYHAEHQTPLCTTAFAFRRLIMLPVPCPGRHISSVCRCLSEIWQPFK